MKILFDTSSLVEIERGSKRSLDVLDSLKQHELFISTVSVAELLVGVHLSEKKGAQDSVTDVLRLFVWANVDGEVAQAAAGLSAWRIKNGKSVQFQDDLIAATAMVYDHAMLITENKKHFDIPALKGKVKSFADF